MRTPTCDTCGVSLPTAVASGIDARPDDAFVPVRPVRAGIVAGVFAAVYLVVVYVAQPLPDRFVRLVGGQGGELGRSGGVRLVWQPPAGYDFARIGDQLERHGTRVTRQGDRAVIDIGGVAADEAQDVAEALTQKPLEFHEVVESDAMKSLIKTLGLPMKGQWPLDADVTQWRPEEGVGTHTDYFLRARTRLELEQAFAKARSLGWSLPPATHIGYEHEEGTSEHPADYWMTYVLADEIGLDGTDVANAIGTSDPYTHRPIVSVEMTREGAEKFGDLTARITGHKLATTEGDIVKSAPIINGVIRGGRVQITMGYGDPVVAERERDQLVKVLRAGALPAGGTLISEDILKPTDTPLQLWLARLLLALGGGAMGGLFAWIVVRATRPVRRRAPAAQPGPWPASRILLTVFAPAVVVLGVSYLPVPTIDYEALSRAMGPSAIHAMNLGALGITPLIGAYLISELLAITVWRKRRHAGTVARRPIRDAFIIVAIVLTALQAWTISTYLQSIGFEDVMPRTSQARLEVVAAFGLATAAFAAVAAVIRSAGLGNGYGALITCGWVVALMRALTAEPASVDIVLLAQIVAVASIVAIVLRWRVYGAGEAMLRVPTSGVMPAAYVRMIYVALGVVAFTGLSVDLHPVRAGLTFLSSHTMMRSLLALALVAAFSAAFAWPSAIPAEAAGLARPSWRTWTRATGVSVAMTAALLVALLVPAHARRVVDLVEVPIVVAFLLDAYDDMRARRVILDRVWTVHSAQRAELVERQLRDAGIPCHLTGAHVRTILGGFGAFAPIEVLVPTEHAPAAHTLLGSN